MHKQWEAEEAECHRLIDLVLHGGDNEVVQHIKKLPQHSRKSTITHLNKDGDSAFHLAALRERLEGLTAMLDANVDIATRNGSGESPLYVCLCHNALKSARLLLDHGADPNEVVGRKDNESLLHRMVKADRRAAVDMLLDANVSVNTQTHDGDTPLHFAARYNKPIMARLLVRIGANVNLTNENHETALHTAVLNASDDVARILIKAKASVSIPDNHGMTPLHMAVAAGQADLAKIMLAANSTHVNSKEKVMGRTPLLLACSGRSHKMAPLLLSHGADANLTTNYRKTVLHLAASVGNTHALNAVIKHASNLNALSTNNKTPLHCAVSAHQVEAVSTLLRAGVNPNCKDIEGDTALHLAAADGDERIASQLLQQPGILINATNMRQRTPLHAALMAGHEQIGSLLLAAGSDETMCDVFEKSAIDYLDEFHNRAVEDEKEEIAAHEATKVHFSFENGDEFNGDQAVERFVRGEQGDADAAPFGTNGKQDVPHVYVDAVGDLGVGELVLENGKGEHNADPTTEMDNLDSNGNESASDACFSLHEPCEGTPVIGNGEQGDDANLEGSEFPDHDEMLASSDNIMMENSSKGHVKRHTKHKGRHRKISNSSGGSGHNGGFTTGPSPQTRSKKHSGQKEGKYRANMLGMVVGGQGQGHEHHGTDQERRLSQQERKLSHHGKHEAPESRRRKLGVANLN